MVHHENKNTKILKIEQNLVSFPRNLPNKKGGPQVRISHLERTQTEIMSNKFTTNIVSFLKKQILSYFDKILFCNYV